MTCSEFESQISNFIYDDIDYSILREFILHLRSCKSCYDDLGIFYLTNVGLGKVEKDETISYDFNGELEQIISHFEKIIKRITYFKLITKYITITANIIVLIVFVVGILICFNVL